MNSGLKDKALLTAWVTGLLLIISEVLLDDRNERPGVKFNDADLVGIPWRVLVGDKGLAQSPPAVEIKRRSEKENRMVELETAAGELAQKIREELALLNG